MHMISRLWLKMSEESWKKPIKCAIKLYYMKANVKSTETIADITAFLHVMSSEDFHLIVPYSLTV